MTSARQGEVRMHIDASPEAVWSTLADVERMGEWSPECYRVKWLDGAEAPATTGARFKGHNKSGLLRWSMTCEVKVADRGRELAWSTVKGGHDVVVWRYRLDPSNGGTDVTESFEALRWPFSVRVFEDIVMRDRDHKRDHAMRTTLERIKAVVEAQEAR